MEERELIAPIAICPEIESYDLDDIIFRDEGWLASDR